MQIVRSCAPLEKRCFFFLFLCSPNSSFHLLPRTGSGNFKVAAAAAALLPPTPVSPSLSISLSPSLPPSIPLFLEAILEFRKPMFSCSICSQ